MEVKQYPSLDLDNFYCLFYYLFIVSSTCLLSFSSLHSYHSLAPPTQLPSSPYPMILRFSSQKKRHPRVIDRTGTNKIQYAQEQILILSLGKATHQEEDSPKSRCKSQKDLYTHCQESHKQASNHAYMQRIQNKSIQAL